MLRNISYPITFRESDQGVLVELIGDYAMGVTQIDAIDFCNQQLSASKQRIQSLTKQAEELTKELLSEKVYASRLGRELTRLKKSQFSGEVKSPISQDFRGPFFERIEAIFEQSGGGPLRSGEIAQKLEESGFVYEGNGTLKNWINSELNRKEDLFERIDRGVYVLKT